jgi:sec-independent protein translocase protein TatC
MVVRMRRRHRATAQSATQRNRGTASRATIPFIEHLYELRRRAVFVAASIIAWSIAAYALERRIVAYLLLPARGQSFIYTSPIDGMNFLFKLSLYVGIALSIPVIVYHFLRFIEPLMQRSSLRFICYSTVISGVLALVGMAFGYFVGLPAALYFLLHQFVNVQVHPLLTIDAYLSFVLVYMLGSALVFQIPLVVLFINRIRPLTPRGLLKCERWAVLFAVVLGFIMNPTPNLLDQMFVIGPIILSYQLSIVLVWWQNRMPKQLLTVYAMRERDAKTQAERSARQAELRPLVDPAHSAAALPVAVPQLAAASPASVYSTRPRKYVDGFV